MPKELRNGVYTETKTTLTVTTDRYIYKIQHVSRVILMTALWQESIWVFKFILTQINVSK